MNPEERMSSIRWLVAALATVGLVASGVVSCGVTQGTGQPPPGYGQLEVMLVDAPLPQVKEIVVSIDKVTAHASGQGWVTISNDDVTVDLLRLQHHATSLGFANLPAGKVTQIRLYLQEGGAQYVTLASGAQVALKVPSGLQSGIKIKGPFQIEACEKETVTIDFDGKKSIWVHPTGQGDLWILRPVIHTKKSSGVVVGCTDPGGPGMPEGGGGSGGGDGSGGGGGDLPGFAEGGGSGGGSGDSGTGSAGDPCSAGSACLSGSCAAGVCEVSGPGGACNVNGDCASWVCLADGTCSSGNAGGNGSACSHNSQCLSNACVQGVCGEGNQGAPCSSAADCALGFSCIQSTCQVLIN
jgi:uncharacterized membrane protein YgcG